MEWILKPPQVRDPVLNGRLVARTEAKLLIMSSCHLRHLSFRASAIPSFPSPTPLHGRTILPCMPSLSSSPAYIHLIPIEYHSTLPLKPLLCYRTRFFHKSSAFPPSPSSYQRRDRCRHPASHVFCIVRWSPRSPQRHPYPTLRWKRTSARSHISSLRRSFYFFLQPSPLRALWTCCPHCLSFLAAYHLRSTRR